MEFLFGKRFNCDKDIPDLAGKVIIVTGGNTGLGLETVLQLAKHNPKQIFLAARTQSKAEQAIAQIKKEVPTGNVTYLPLDLTKFSSIKECSRLFAKQSDRLDILINNAGIMMTPQGWTEEQYEIQFGTNHVGHALLTKLLMPTLLKTAKDHDVRIVNVSSEGHNLAPGKMVFDQPVLQNAFTFSRYGYSKLANILHARALAKRYPQITACSIHPGVIITDLYNSLHNTFWLAKFGTSLLNAVCPNVHDGAKNQLWAAMAPKEEVRKGYYFKPVGSASKGSWQAQNEAEADRLWAWTEDEFKKHGIEE